MSADRDRFEQLFAANYGAVVRYAVRRVDADTAQEIVSETFTVAWRRFSEVPENALPWLYATARRLIANEVRRQRRNRTFVQSLPTDEHAASLDPASIVGTRLKVQRALAGLREPDREVLRLHAWEQLSVVDAARVLGCGTAAYKVRLHRARRRFKALLGDEHEAPAAIHQEEFS